MTLSYNELPPHTKDAATKMGELYDNDYNKWKKYRDKLGYDYAAAAPAATAITVAAGHWRSYQVEIKLWLEAIKAFELLTTDIMLELAPFLLGAQQNV